MVVLIEAPCFTLREKLRCHAEREVKTEESEKEDDDIKEEESTQSVDGADDHSEPPRKYEKYTRMGMHERMMILIGST